jgi:hypothetical protein
MTKAVFSEESRNDPGVERPDERSGFRHADLPAWVHEGARLVVAGLTVLPWYVREGEEPSKPP